VAGFPEAMGFQIRQTRPANLRDAMEAAHNYENSTQSLRVKNPFMSTVGTRI
jgi:hypothetical protein